MSDIEEPMSDERLAEVRALAAKFTSDSMLPQMVAEVDRLRAALAELEWSLTELAPSAAIIPTTEVVVDGDIFTWDDLPGVLSRTRESLAVARHEAKQHYLKHQKAEAAVERVKALHRSIPLYEPCDDADCEQEHTETVANGQYVHEGLVEGHACEECRDESGDFIDYPCPTIRALEGEDR